MFPDSTHKIRLLLYAELDANKLIQIESYTIFVLYSLS